MKESSHKLKLLAHSTSVFRFQYYIKRCLNKNKLIQRIKRLFFEKGIYWEPKIEFINVKPTW